MEFLLVFSQCFAGYQNLTNNGTSINFTAVPSNHQDCEFPEDVPLEFSIVSNSTLGSAFLYFSRHPLRVLIKVSSLVPEDYEIVAYFGQYTETLISLDELHRSKHVFIVAALCSGVLLLIMLICAVVFKFILYKRKMKKIASYVDDWIDRSFLDPENQQYIVAVDENITKHCREPGHLVDMY